MKYLYLLIFTCISFYSQSQAQDWQPFPYDSVYFINIENDKDILIPVVKTSDPENILIDMSTYGRLSAIENMYPRYVPHESFSEPAHWFGDNLTFNQGVLSFNSLIFKDTLRIALDANLHDTDTQIFYIKPTPFDSIRYYFTYKVDSIYYDPILIDTVKSIELTLLNEDQEIVTEDYDPGYLMENIPLFDVFCLNGFLDIETSTYNKRILIGQTTGIQEIPNLAFYPYSGSYKKHITVDALELLITTPMFDVGDRIDETFEHFGNLTWSDYIRKESKKVITLLYVNTIDETFDFVAQQWERTFYSDTSTTPSSETFEPNAIFSIPYTYDSYIFNGINSSFVHINSDWGIPLVGSVVYSVNEYSGYAHFANLTTMSSTNNGVIGTYNTHCVTYHTLNDDEFGSIHDFSTSEYTLPQPEAWVTQHTLHFSTPVYGNLTIYSVDGKEMFKTNLLQESISLPVSVLETGMYFVVLNDLNITVKIVVD